MSSFICKALLKNERENIEKYGLCSAIDVAAQYRFNFLDHGAG